MPPFDVMSIFLANSPWPPPPPTSPPPHTHRRRWFPSPISLTIDIDSLLLASFTVATALHCLCKLTIVVTPYFRSVRCSSLSRLQAHRCCRSLFPSDIYSSLSHLQAPRCCRFYFLGMLIAIAAAPMPSPSYRTSPVACTT